jgi:hypothetical protein
VIQKIQAGNFWPPVYDPVPDFSDDLAAICLDNLLQPALSEDNEEEAGDE